MNRYFARAGGGLAACVALSTSHAHAETANQVDHTASVTVARSTVGPALFGTVAVPIAATRFWDDWERARRDSMSPRMRNLIRPAADVTREQQIAYVQKAVTRLISWRSDATQWGRHDYWASADETLSGGLGDGEDRAIVKMHALRALGFSTRDLFLTLGRDKVAGPQAMLIVKLRNRYLVLDDNGTTPFTPDKRPEFTPVLTFAFGGFWAHMSDDARDPVRSLSFKDESGRVR